MNWLSAIDETVTGLGYELVDTERAARGLLRITIDRVAGAAYADGGAAVTVDDCEKVTRQLQHVLEVEGFAYERLEVSSPGLDRPLKKAADYARFAGEVAEITLKLPFKGRKKYRGVLEAGGEGGWRLVLQDEAAARPGRKPAKPAVKAAAQALKKKANADAAETGTDRVLDFSLDEVREARLVPVVDFKGRRFAPPQLASAEEPQAGFEVDGGQNK